jgi:hypothetical protein
MQPVILNMTMQDSAANGGDYCLRFGSFDYFDTYFIFTAARVC